MSFPTLSAKDMAMLETACEGDQNTLGTIEAFCSSKTDGGVCEVVQDRLVHAKGTAVFAAGLARVISRLRSLGGRPDSHRKGRVLRAVGLCVSKALQADLAELRILGLHRGLRHPALLLALTELVPDNSVGSDAQRAAASALVAFCDRSPTLWKELAKLIRGDAKLLKGFLGQVSTLASITDHRTQEIAFEAVYRMWKVWKKQPGGPPALPSSTRGEIKEGLSGISTTDFESQVRSMLATINTGGNCESDDGGCDGPPSSFPVETVCQVTDWAGLGCEQRLGEVRWLDIGGDSISIQVYSKSSRGRDDDNSPGVFVSIPADLVAASSKIMVGTRSMQLDVPFAQCPALIRVAKKPPGSELGSVSCTLIFRLQGGAKTFNLLRKAIAGLTSTVANNREEDPSPRPAKASLVSSNDVAGYLRGKEQRLPNKQPTPVAPGGNRRDETKCVRRPEQTPTKAADNQGRLGVKERRLSNAQVTPSATGGKPRSVTKGVRLSKETPKKTADNQLVNEKSRPVTEPTTSPFELTEANVNSVNAMAAPTPKKKPTPSQPLKTKLCGSANITVTPTVRAMFRRGDSRTKSTVPIRSIAEGKANAPLSVGSVDESTNDEEDVEKDSWMEPRQRLDLAPASDKSRVPNAKNKKQASRAKHIGMGSGFHSAVPERKEKDWEISDEDGEVSALSQSPQQLSPAGITLGKRAEKKSGAMLLESDNRRKNAETVKRGYSPGVGYHDDGTEDPVTTSIGNRKRPAPGSGSATDAEQTCRYRPQIDYAECNSEESEEEAEEVSTTNDGPNEDCEENSAPWKGGKAGFSNTRADDGEQSESGDDTDRYCDAEESFANDDSGGGGSIEEEEDSAMLAQLYKQLVMASQARDKRSKKRKTDARMEDAWEECGIYLERTSQAVVEHWRRQAEELLEEGKRMGEAVGAAKEAVRAMNMQHEAQWNASKERLRKHASVLERLGGHLASGPGASSSSLERQREDERTALQLELQEHRVGVVSRFAKTLTSVDKKKPKTAFGAGRGSSIANTSALLSHLKIRSKK